MPLKIVQYRGQELTECPLGKFQIDIPAGAGCYNADPVEACSRCNFANLDTKEFNLEKICQCPQGMIQEEYEILKRKYVVRKGPLTKQGFRNFVAENYKPS